MWSQGKPPGTNFYPQTSVAEPRARLGGSDQPLIREVFAGNLQEKLQCKAAQRVDRRNCCVCVCVCVCVCLSVRLRVSLSLSLCVLEGTLLEVDLQGNQKEHQHWLGIPNFDRYPKVKMRVFNVVNPFLVHLQWETRRKPVLKPQMVCHPLAFLEPLSTGCGPFFGG